MLKTIFLKPENSPTDIAVSSARTCYSSKGIIYPEFSSEWNRKESLLSDLFNSGHHTTLQHTYITILIPKISRHLVWRLLHSHSFYNSEQVSQRYANMNKDNFILPNNGDKDNWNYYYSKVFDYYNRLKEELSLIIDNHTTKNRKKDNPKKAMEFARYILPQGCSTYLYHTVNIITILRYISLAKDLDEASSEAKEFGESLARNLLELDPKLEILVNYAKSSKAIFSDFDLGKFKKDKNIKDERVKVYEASGDLDFEFNTNYSDILKLSQMSFDSGMIGSFNSYIKLSFSADAQNQRHRRSLAIRPHLKNIYKKDYYIPPVIAKYKNILKLYNEAMDYTYNFFENEVKLIGFGEAIYALPNAHNIEIIEKNDFSSFAHKAQMRLCFNAQEEIFEIVNSQVRDLEIFYPNARDYFMPPCASRFKHGIKPVCPEGRLRYCGVKVWKEDLTNYNRII